MNLFNKIFGSQSTPDQKAGLPVYEAVIQGHKLDRRDIHLTINGEKKTIPICTLREQFYAGLIPGDLAVLVTNFYCQVIYYCGEGTVAGVVAAWESAVPDSFDLEDSKRMIKEFSFPEYQITSKAIYQDLKRLYDRCDSYYRFVNAHSRDFKRLTREATKELVFLLDAGEPGWESTDGVNRFVEELKRRQPQLLRSEAEKKTKKAKDKKKKLEQEERRPLVEMRNNLTNFPYKNIQIEVKDQGFIEIRTIKERLRDGSLSAENLVRYRPDAIWMELSDFLDDWIRNKATNRQIDYLNSLQTQHGVTTEIPLDSSRRDISDRIGALVAGKI